MPNVKAGDLAIVRSSKPQYHGRIVEIIAAAPAHGFRLPNGQWHEAIKDAALHWIIKAVGGPLLGPINGEMRPVWYGAGADSCLFPLPGDADDERIDESTPVTVGAKHGEA